MNSSIRTVFHGSHGRGKEEVGTGWWCNTTCSHSFPEVQAENIKSFSFVSGAGSCSSFCHFIVTPWSHYSYQERGWCCPHCWGARPQLLKLCGCKHIVLYWLCWCLPQLPMAPKGLCSSKFMYVVTVALLMAPAPQPLLLSSWTVHRAWLTKGVIKQTSCPALWVHTFCSLRHIYVS